MDFKVAGTRDGITAIQLDIKVKSIGLDVIADAMEQGQQARLEILDRIYETITETRPELSPYAPRMSRIQIPVDRIGMVIGPGGKTIRGIIEATGATVDVQNDGSVFVGAADGDAADRAIKMIRDLTRDVEVGEIYTGKVVKIANFGAFVELLPGKDGLVHISELADHHIPSVEDVVELGEEITVVVTEIDSMGRVNLSRRALIEGPDRGEDGATGGYRPAQGQSDAGRSGPGDRRGGGQRPYGQQRGGPGGGQRSRPDGRRGPPR
jgi:polyribonucleotide nucleotidyltransferase